VLALVLPNVPVTSATPAPTPLRRELPALATTTLASSELKLVAEAEVTS